MESLYFGKCFDGKKKEFYLGQMTLQEYSVIKFVVIDLFNDKLNLY